jgi:hypothetical protein
MEVRKEILFIRVCSVSYIISESISQVVILYFRRYNLVQVRWYMHNDVHKVTARNKWR